MNIKKKIYLLIWLISMIASIYFVFFLGNPIGNLGYIIAFFMGILWIIDDVKGKNNET